MSKIDVIIISYNRLEELKCSVNSILKYSEYINKIIVIDNNSQDGTREWLKTCNFDIFDIVINDINLGVSGGRNLGILKSRADILVFIDDDAIFEDSTNNPFMILKEEFSDNKCGIVAFKIVNYFTRNIEKHEFPFVDKKVDENLRRFCGYYIGAGHAISKQVFIDCGLYPEDFFYGKEELDLSLRAIKQQFHIVYNPNIKVLHKQSPNGRQPNDRKWMQIYRNRLVVSYKYFSFCYRIIANCLWFVKVAIISKSIFVPFAGLIKYLKERKHIQKNRLAPEDINYIKKYSGRLYF